MNTAPVLKDPPPPEECPDCGQEYEIIDRIDLDGATRVYAPRMPPPAPRVR